MTSLAVVVPTRDRPRLLSRCLDALRSQLQDGDQLIVADSASTQLAVVAAAAQHHGAQVVRLDRPGASAARNAGWRAADAPVVGFVDDDVRVRPGWRAAMVAAFADPAVAFVTGRVVVPDDQLLAERPVAVTSRTERTALHPGLTGDLGASANLAVRAEVLERVGGFDETLGPGSWAASAEDLDLFDRIFRLGLAGSFEPAALAEHDQWRSKRQLIGLDWRYGKGMGVRLARMRAWDRPRSRRLLREALVEQGLTPIRRDVRAGYQFGALTVSTRTVGTVVGLTVGAARRRLP